MARKDAKLSDEQKEFVINELAAWESPSEIAAAVRERFGVAVTPQAIEAYDPTKYAGRRLGKAARAKFERARERAKTDLSAIPEAHKTVRVRQLAKLARNARSPVLAASLLEQIAKETGGAFTNRHEFTGRDGGPIEKREVGGLTDEQVLEELARMLGAPAAGADAPAGS